MLQMTLLIVAHGIVQRGDRGVTSALVQNLQALR